MKTTNLGLFLLRIAVGGIFVAHGAQKLFVYGIPGVTQAMAQMGIPFPALSALAVTGAEFLGGLALLAGLFTRLAALPLAFSMLVAALAVHLKAGFFLPHGVEYVAMLLFASVALALTGPGAYSIDGLLARRSRVPFEIRKPETVTVR